MYKIIYLLFFIIINTFPQSAYSTKFDWDTLTEALCENPEQFDLTEISGGTTNRNYRLHIANRDFFLRMPLSPEINLGSDLQLEFEVLQKLMPLGIAPYPYYYNPDHQVMITEFMHHDGVDLDFSNYAHRQVVVNLIKSFHNSQITIHKSFNPFEIIDSHIADLKFRDAALPNDLEKIIVKLVEEIKVANVFHDNEALCHHDIHPGNILKCGDRYVLIDWEYAAMSDPLYDVASVASIAFWNDAQTEQLLKEYNPYSTEEDLQRIKQLRKLSDIRWYLWCELQKSQFPGDPQYAEWSTYYLESFSSSV